jgi:hypothetical protein
MAHGPEQQFTNLVETEQHQMCMESNHGVALVF